MPKSVTDVDLIADSALVAESPQGREYKLEAYLSLALDPGHTALDVGSGPGTDLPALAEAVTVTGSVIGVDLRPTMVAEARRRMADVPWVQVLEGDAAALPLENNRVDRARADRTLQDVEDPASVFAEIHRVLCPGGIAVVADFDWATISIDGDEEAGLAFNEYVITEAVRNAAIGRQLRRLTLGAGLEVVEVWQKPVLIDEFDYADKLLGLTDNMKRAAQAGYLAHAAGEQWLTHLQVGPFFAAIQMFIAVARKPGEVASAGR